MARVSIVVSAELPRGVSISEWKDYVLTEVKANTGRLHPEDPLFSLDRSSVKVTRLTVKATDKIVPKGPVNTHASGQDADEMNMYNPGSAHGRDG